MAGQYAYWYRGRMLWHRRARWVFEGACALLPLFLTHYFARMHILICGRDRKMLPRPQMVTWYKTSRRYFWRMNLMDFFRCLSSVTGQPGFVLPKNLCQAGFILPKTSTWWFLYEATICGRGHFAAPVASLKSACVRNIDSRKRAKSPQASWNTPKNQT